MVDRNTWARTPSFIPNSRPILLLSIIENEQRQQFLGLHSRRTAQAALAERSLWHSAVSRRHALSPGGHGVVSTAGFAREHFALLRRRAVCGGRFAGEWLSAAAVGFRIRPRHRPCDRHLSCGRVLGSRGEIEFYGMPVSRAGAPDAARTGHQLLQPLFQSARRAHAAHVFAPREPEAFRSSRLDEFGEARMVCGGVSADDFPLSADFAGAGEAPSPRGWAIIPGRVSGAGRQEVGIVGTYFAFFR